MSAQGKALTPDVLAVVQRTVVEMTADGLSAAEIGRRLGIGPRTVVRYRARARAGVRPGVRAGSGE